MDNMECRFDLPQEDEFALCVMTGYSPYLLPIFQHSPRKIDRFFDVQKGLDAHELQEWKDALMLLMKKVTLKTGKPIVLKSPSHTFRTKVLLEMFPDAKFVYIYRNPYAVLKSSVHFRKTIFEENALGKTQKEDMTDEVLNIYENCFRTYEADKTLVPKGNLHEICFEDLEADPLGQMKTMYESLNMSGFEGLQAVLEPQVESLRRYKKNKFTDDREVMQRIYKPPEVRLRSLRLSAAAPRHRSCLEPASKAACGKRRFANRASISERVIRLISRRIRCRPCGLAAAYRGRSPAGCRHRPARSSPLPSGQMG